MKEMQKDTQRRAEFTRGFWNGYRCEGEEPSRGPRPGVWSPSEAYRAGWYAGEYEQDLAEDGGASLGHLDRAYSRWLAGLGVSGK